MEHLRKRLAWSGPLSAPPAKRPQLSSTFSSRVRAAGFDTIFVHCTYPDYRCVPSKLARPSQVSALCVTMASKRGTACSAARCCSTSPKNGREILMRERDREAAESVFDRSERREAETDSALKHENARHEAAMKNMHRLRLLRMQRDALHRKTPCVNG